MSDIVAEYNNAWKGRGSLAQLAQELERQKETRIDFVAPASALRYAHMGGVPTLLPTERTSEFMLQPHRLVRAAESQFYASLEPNPGGVKLADAAAAAGEYQVAAYSEFVNELLRLSEKRRLVRCLDGEVRAWLSDGYRAYESYDLMFVGLEEAQRAGGRPFECSLSDRFMRIKFLSTAIFEKIVETQANPRGNWFSGGLGNQEYLSKVNARSGGELPGGPDALYPVITIQNSETGHGAAKVLFGLLLGFCWNVATVEEMVHEVHLGSRLDLGIFRPETQQLETRVIMEKLKDTIRAAFTPEKFAEIVGAARMAQSYTVQPVEAVDSLVKAGDIPQERRDALLEHFVRDYAPSRFGLAQAVSRLAQDYEDGDDAAELERVAGRILVKA